MIEFFCFEWLLPLPIAPVPLGLDAKPEFLIPLLNTMEFVNPLLLAYCGN